MKSNMDEVERRILPEQPNEPLGYNFMSPLLALVVAAFSCLVVMRYEPAPLTNAYWAKSSLPPKMKQRVAVLNQLVNELHHDLRVMQTMHDGVTVGALIALNEPQSYETAPLPDPDPDGLLQLTQSLDALSTQLHAFSEGGDAQ